MMPTYTAQTHTKPKPQVRNTRRAFTFTELIVVVMLVSLFVLLAVNNIFGLLGASTFKAQAQELVSAMQMAVSAAAESDRKYEIIIDIPQQSYMLREISAGDLTNVLVEEIIIENELTDNCIIVSVLFDDGVFTNQDRARFRAGHAGWQAGGKIALIDSNEKEYSIIVNRRNRIITLKQGDVEILWPKREDEIPF
jgi:Tfp pilus assembly protein FimT